MDEEIIFADFILVLKNTCHRRILQHYMGIFISYTGIFLCNMPIPMDMLHSHI